MVTVRQALWGVLLLALGCTGCGSAHGDRVVQITHAYYHYPTRRLGVDVDSCRADVESEVAETTRQVTVTRYEGLGFHDLRRANATGLWRPAST